VQLASEEIHAQVAVLARGRRRGNANDLRWPSLEDQNVAETNVMTRDGDSTRVLVIVVVTVLAALATNFNALAAWQVKGKMVSKEMVADRQAGQVASSTKWTHATDRP
jgi:hypothetical protein